MTMQTAMITTLWRRRIQIMTVGRQTIRAMAISFAGAAVLAGGCISYTKETTERTVPVPVTAAAPVPGDRVVTYPEGRYQLYGNGSSVPYYWVWVPNGGTPTAAPPAPPPVPTR